MGHGIFTWESLGTLAGASLLVYIITAYTKRLSDRFWPWGTDLYAVMVGAVLLTLTQLASGASVMDWQVYALAIANGFFVAATAGKLADKTIQERERKDRQGAI